MKKIGILLLTLIFITGCSNKKVIVSDTREGSAITNEVKEKVLVDKDNSVEYDFTTSSYNIKVNLDYNETYKLNKKELEADYYKVYVYVEEYTVPYFDSINEATEEKNKLKISGYDAIRMVTDIKVMTLVRIDKNTIVYIIGESMGCMAKEIEDSISIKNLINSIKITANKK